LATSALQQVSLAWASVLRHLLLHVQPAAFLRGVGLQLCAQSPLQWPLSNPADWPE
jgi:hypothetical protein